jgi:hypothetical protein
MAFPVSAPTTLPTTLRARKDLTEEDIAANSKVHPSFDESAGKKMDKHNRRINSTTGRGMVAQTLSGPRDRPSRPLEEKIRYPSDSMSSDDEVDVQI